MADYINREKLLEHIKDLPTWWSDGGGIYSKPMKYPDGMFYCEDVVASIENTPAADVEHVIRCKDCRHWSDNDGIHTDADGVRFARCRIHNYETLNGLHEGWCPAENCYCSLGEREENINGD